MSTITVSDIPLDSASPAEHLRRTAAAVRVHFTWWGTKKSLSAEQKDEAANPFGADGSFMSASKKLVDTKHPKFKAVTAVKGRISSYWNGISLPYTEPGMRLVKQSAIEPFVQQMSTYRDELRDAEIALDRAFMELKDQARQRLGRLYNLNDYPAEINGLFLVEWDFPSVEPPHYLMTLAPEVYEQERQRVAARFEQAVVLAEQSFAAEFGRMVGHLAEVLTPNADGTPRRFQASSLTNLTAFFDRFRSLGLRSNADLDRMVDQAQGLVRGLSPDELRTMPAVRADVAAQMSGLATQLEGLIVNQPRRRILRQPQLHREEE